MASLHPRIATPSWMRLQQHLEALDFFARPIAPAMVRNTPVVRLFEDALARARAAIPGAEVESVVLNVDPNGHSCSLYASFFDPALGEGYAVRLSREGAVLFEERVKDGGSERAPRVPDLRGMRLSFVDAISAALMRYPRAKFNWLALSARQGGGLDLEAFHSNDWQSQPSVSIDSGVKSARVTAEQWDASRNRFVSDRPRVMLE
jgi:hypothetical protein